MSTIIDESENTCVVCFKTASIFSIGECDHPVCYECSTRMRVLCRQNECPICRQDLAKVYFTRVVVPFRNLRHLDSNLYDRKFNIYFDSSTSRNEFHRLLEHQCRKCQDKPIFRNFAFLKDHMRREHELFFCDLCVENLRIFTSERRCYTRAELGHHRRKGDLDNRSHRGHPLCEFCEQRYMDNDELYRHLRRDHLFCHFCDADGFHQYYSTYNYLRDHFRAEHFLCEEGNCINEQFTSVYRSDIDLKAHIASVHSRSLGKAATKQARTLELEFTLAPRPVPERRSRQNHHFVEEEVPVDSLSPPPTNASINTDCIQEFPTLSGAPAKPAAMSIRTIRSSGPNFNGRPLAVTDENFPALGPETASSSNPSSSTAGPSLRLRVNQTKSPPNVSIHVNHRHNGGISSQNIRFREDFPSLGSGANVNPIGTSWVSVRGSSQKKSNITNTTPSKNKNKVVPKSSDFPALKQSFNAYCTVAPKTVQNKHQNEAYSTEATKTVQNKHQNEAYSTEATKTVQNKHQNEAYSTEATKTAQNKQQNLAYCPAAPKTVQNKPQSEAYCTVTPKTVQNKQQNEEKSTISKNNKKKNKASKNSQKKDEPTNRLTSASTSNTLTNKQANGTERKRSELHIEPAVPPPGFTSQPPPGFSNNSANTGPPPGFSSVTLNSIARTTNTDNGLTFTNSSGQSYAILPESRNGIDSSNSQYTYVAPADFSQRNKNLVTRVMNTLAGDSSLETFRQYSTLFRQGLFTAESFYNHCLNAMGVTSFEEIFPELLVLLPDITKQQELLLIHRTTSSSGPLKNLEECATCRQILSKNDLRYHLRSHSMENNFPALGAPPEVNIGNKAWGPRK